MIVYIAGAMVIVIGLIYIGLVLGTLCQGIAFVLYNALQLLGLLTNLKSCLPVNLDLPAIDFCIDPSKDVQGIVDDFIANVPRLDELAPILGQ